MYLFFATFVSLYGGMHLYVFLKARKALHPRFGYGAALGIGMLVMTFAPFLVRMSEKHGHDLIARFLSYSGYVWMGVIFLFCAFSLALDLYRVLLHAGGALLQRNLTDLRPSPLLNFSLPLVLAVAVSTLGYFEARDIRTETIVIETSKIPEHVGRLTIAQISDVHAGLIVREGRLKRILTAVEEAEPDILVSTGDLVDGQIDNLANLTSMLRQIQPRYGKYAVTGNHEFYAGLEQALLFTERSGFQLLRGEGVTVAGLINIAGVDDPAGKRYGLYNDVSEAEVLSRLPEEQFTILLKHRPLVNGDATEFFDLQLSGHTHKGQIFPFNLFTKLYYPIHAGFMSLNEKTSLYVSRGSGTWGPPVRFLSPPEVTIIDIIYNRDF